ncbi:hypothetical protein EH223_18050 [candidate division KSB1 bacterium]|nr:AAA family ATPase [candidate division KSB1 bacterium]RQW00652.1 MAG: hypothetical protein EH223_18050 [candidate division KSB1 bacterium]
MLKEQLIKKSPIRVFEDALDGGLAAGHLGVMTARKGVGKTASLVHIATDKLLRGQNVLHISFADDPKHIVTWYEQVFRELAKAYKLENAMDIHDEIIRHRLILHFKQKDVPFQNIKSHIEQLQAGFSGEPHLIVVDGFPFEESTTEKLAEWQEFAHEKHIAIWFSATLHRENLDLDEHHVPSPINKYYSLFQIIIMLNPVKSYVEFNLLKSQKNGQPQKLQLKLDPQTLLISNHRVSLNTA